MTPANKNLWIQYGLWALNGICIVALVSQLGKTPTPMPNRPLTTGQQYLLDTLGAERLLTYAPVQRLDRVSTGLRVGTYQLPVVADTIGKTRFWVPISNSDWRQSVTDWLGGSETDSIKRWSEARRQWESALRPALELLAKNPDWKKLTAEQQLAHALLVSLDNASDSQLFLINGSLQRLSGVQAVSVNSVDSLSLLTKPSQIAPAEDSSGWWQLIALIGGLVTLGGILQTYWNARQASISPLDQETDDQDDSPAEAAPQPIDSPHPLPDNPLPAVSSPAISVGDSLPSASFLHLYLTNFYLRYGDFYKFMQDIPIEPSAGEIQLIKRRLVEMGLHAHSLARAYKHNGLEQPTNEPNLLLILEQKQVSELPVSLIKEFDSDPYKIAKNFQFLQQVLQTLDLGELEGVLLQNVHLSSPFLKSS